LRGLMRQLTKQDLPFAFGTVSDKGPRFMLLHKTKKGAALAKELRTAGCKKVTFGTASADASQLNLDVEGPSISGLGAQVKAFLAESKKMPFTKVSVPQPSADGT